MYFFIRVLWSTAYFRQNSIDRKRINLMLHHIFHILMLYLTLYYVLYCIRYPVECYAIRHAFLMCWNFYINSISKRKYLFSRNSVVRWVKPLRHTLMWQLETLKLYWLCNLSCNSARPVNWSPTNSAPSTTETAEYEQCSNLSFCYNQWHHLWVVFLLQCNRNMC